MNDLSEAGVDLRQPGPRTGLSHLSLLIIRGPDARTFLDSQLTRNVPTTAGVASPAGYCSPKGRLLASCVIWLDGDAIALLLSRDIAEAIAKRLRMYVLRAKVTIEDTTADLRLDGIVDAAALPPWAADLASWAVGRNDAMTLVRFPDVGGRPRWLRVASMSDPGDANDAVDAATWRRLDIESGLATITAATQDRFVPQMLNLEAIGGVDFKKGCFPGQEVVARSQYLGKLKRRMALASSGTDQVPPPATDVWMAGHHEASGLVVNAERADDRVVLLVELPTSLFESDALRIGGVDGPALTLEPLPYPLPDNEVFVRPKL